MIPNKSVLFASLALACLCFIWVGKATAPQLVHGGNTAQVSKADTPPAAIPQDNGRQSVAQLQTVADQSSSSVDRNTTYHGHVGATASPARQNAQKSITLDAVAGTLTSSDGTQKLRTYKPLATPNDPYATQWWTTQTGLPQLWDMPAGSAVTIAIIDTGFALQHEEFSGRWATNSGEIGATNSQAASVRNCTDRNVPLNRSCNLIDDNFDGVVDNEIGATNRQNPSQLNCTDQNVPLNKSCNRLDDDNNGYADDVTGWDFVNYDSNVQAGETNPAGSGTSHGTEVAGIAAANSNNSAGIAGVNPYAKLLPIQALNDDSYGNTVTVADAVRYAADRGAQVISLSLGTDEEDPYLRSAVQYAIDHGSVVVAASGNDGCDCISYPARYPEVLSVGSFGSSGNASSFSNFGAELDILAPGEGMRAPTWLSTNGISAYDAYVSGTSFATPYMSGLLAYAKSQRPSATWAELTHMVLGSADHSGLTNGSPLSTRLGSGYVRASGVATRLQNSGGLSQKYYFGPLTTGTVLDSKRIYQCQTELGDFPTAPVYELRRGQDVQYTINKLRVVRDQASGWSVRQLWIGCVDLPGNTAPYNRLLSIPAELQNNNSKQVLSP